MTRYGRRVDPAWFVVLVFLVILAGLARDCSAQSVSASAGTEILFRSDTSRKFQSFARIQTNIPATSGLRLFLRVDKAVLTDTRPDIFHAATSQFDTLEVYGGAYRRLLGQVHAAGMYGYIVPLQPSKAPEKSPETYGGGVFVGDPSSGRWVLLMAGRHDSAGKGVKFLFAGQVPVDGRITLVSDGVVGGPQGFVRVGIALAVAR